MSKTFLSRLAMLEVLDAAGPLTISELAHRSGLDTAVVSRTVAACEGDGWLTRAAGKVTIGPRATLLGHASPFAEVMARAAPLVHAVADKLAERQSMTIPSEDPDYGDLGQAFPAWTGRGKHAILQPPKPEIRPSAQILERAADRDRDVEAAN